MFGDGNSIAAGRVHHHDAALGGGVQIDVVDADAGASDDAQLGGLVHHGRIDKGRRADNDGVGVGQLSGKVSLSGLTTVQSPFSPKTLSAEGETLSATTTFIL